MQHLDTSHCTGHIAGKYVRGWGSGQLSGPAAHLFCYAQAALHRSGWLALDGQVHGTSTTSHCAPAPVEQGQSDAKLPTDLQAASRSLQLRLGVSSALIVSGSTQQDSSTMGKEHWLRSVRQSAAACMCRQGPPSTAGPQVRTCTQGSAAACLYKLLLAAVQRPGSCHPAGVLARV